MQFQFNISQILRDTGHNYINKFAGLKGSIWNGFDLWMDTSLQIDSLSWALQLQRSWQDKCWTVYNDSLPLASQWQRFPAGQVLVNVQAQPSVKEAYPVPKLDTLEPLYIS